MPKSNCKIFEQEITIRTPQIYAAQNKLMLHAFRKLRSFFGRFSQFILTYLHINRISTILIVQAQIKQMKRREQIKRKHEMKED